MSPLNPNTHPDSPPSSTRPSYRLLTPSELRKLLNQPEPPLPKPTTSTASHSHSHQVPMHSLVDGRGDLTPLSSPVRRDIRLAEIESEEQQQQREGCETEGAGQKKVVRFSAVEKGKAVLRETNPEIAATTSLSFDLINGTTEQQAESRTLCVRHQRMADQGVNAKLQQSLDALSFSERAAITSLWSTFSSSSHPKRKIILEGILTMCCPSQLSHLSESLSQIIRIDPFYLFPKEVSLQVLGYLDAISLGKAAQVSRSWRELADDDLLWRRMCGQHIERKCTRCGWGLPLLERRRLRLEEGGGVEGSAAGAGAVAGAGAGHPGAGSGADREVHAHEHAHMEENEEDRGSGVIVADELPAAATPALVAAPVSEGEASPKVGEKRRLLDEVPVDAGSGSGEASSSAAKRRKTNVEGGVATHAVTSSDSETDAISEVGSTSASIPTALIKPSDSASNASASSSRGRRVASSSGPGAGCGRVEEKSVKPTKRKPWKHVYCERLIVERNWRKGRCSMRTLKGHTNGVMCLQVQHNLPSPAYPVLITGSWDKTIRVWNLDTGEVVRVLTGHTRAVRALQFDQAMLVTGSTDRTLKIWNWRTGECLRTLEGHTDAVVCLNYDRNVLASGSADSTIKIWNMVNGDRFVLRGHSNWVNSVLLWDGKTSPAERAQSAITDPQSAAGAAAVKYLFSASDDGSIKLWDLAQRSCIKSFAGHTGQVQSIKLFIVDREPDCAEEEGQRVTGHISPATPIMSTAVVPAGANGPTACSTPFTHFSATPPASTPSPPAEQSAGTPFKLDLPDDKQALLVSGCLDNTIKVWDVESGSERRTLFGHIEGVWAVDVDPLRLASASHDRTIKIWDRESGRCAQTLVGHRGAVTSLQLSDDMIVSGSDDGEVRVWNFGPGVNGATAQVGGGNATASTSTSSR